jgi:hypothetical protein
MNVVTRGSRYLSRKDGVSHGCDRAVPEFRQKAIGRSPDPRLLRKRVVDSRDQMERRLTWYRIDGDDGAEPRI